jgi:predicted RNA-binding protein YlxR (DUF448 family)
VRTTKADLIRLVLERHGPTPVVTPDTGGSAQGRGAHLHPTTVCLDLAERRRAFSRSLRVDGPLDVSAVREYVETHAARPNTAPGHPGGARQRKRSSRS